MDEVEVLAEDKVSKTIIIKIFSLYFNSLLNVVNLYLDIIVSDNDHHLKSDVGHKKF